MYRRDELYIWYRPLISSRFPPSLSISFSTLFHLSLSLRFAPGSANWSLTLFLYILSINTETVLAVAFSLITTHTVRRRHNKVDPIISTLFETIRCAIRPTTYDRSRLNIHSEGNKHKRSKHGTNYRLTTVADIARTRYHTSKTLPLRPSINSQEGPKKETRRIRSKPLTPNKKRKAFTKAFANFSRRMEAQYASDLLGI